MAGRSHSKDDKRKCSGIRNMWHYGTIDNETIIGRNTRSDDGFSISNGRICKGVRAYDCTIHTLLDLLGVKAKKCIDIFGGYCE